MAGRLAASVVSLLALAAPARSAMATWWTDKGNQIMMQDPVTGGIWHSNCNSNNTPIFPVEEPNVFQLNNKPRNGTSLAGAGWWNSRTTVASIFYQNTKGEIINAFLECDWKRGTYINKGEYPISTSANVPSVHAQTGLSVVLLGSNGGYRLFFHNENRQVQLLYYTSEDNWQYWGDVSNDLPSGMALAAGFTGKDNITLVMPRDSSNIGIARYYPEQKFRLFSLPRPLKQSYNNETATSSIQLNFDVTTNFTLPGYVGNPSGMGVTIDNAYTRSIYYIGTDRALHQVSNINYVWRLMPDQDRKLWPLADSANASLAVTFQQSSNKGWIYYFSNNTLTEVYYGQGGLFSEARAVPTFNATARAIANQPPADDGNSTATDPPAEPQQEPQGLTAGAKAGIGVGVAVGVLALAGTVATLLFLRKRAQDQGHHPVGSGDEAAPAYPGYDEYQQNAPGAPYTPGQQSMTMSPQPYNDFGNLTWNSDAKTLGTMTTGTPTPAPIEAGSYPVQELEGPRPMYELPQQNYSHELIGEGHYQEMPAQPPQPPQPAQPAQR